MLVTFLGTGTSHGIPVIGCSCRVCTSASSYNKRSRTSLWIQNNGYSLLIDTSTDFRMQALREGIQQLDAILFTHSHADHLHGIDDTRTLSRCKPVSAWASGRTMEDIKHRFKYIFDLGHSGCGIPNLDFRLFPEEGLEIGGMKLTAVPLFHGKGYSTGYRINNLAYITDCSFIPAESMKLLKNLDVLIIDALRYRKHPTHLCVSDAVDIAEKLKPGRTYFTHFCHDIEHDELKNSLPKKIEPAYDGLSFSL